MRAPESISQKFTTQTSTAAVVLVGGQYQLAGSSTTWNGAVLTLDQLMPDGVTWVANAPLTNTHANGVHTDYLPGGQYRLTVGTATPTDPVYAALVRIPAE